MSALEIISCVFTGIGTVVSACAAFFTYRNLKEIKKQFFEQNRGNLVLYVDRLKGRPSHTLILKNYGNSPAELICLELDPPLDWGKSTWNMPGQKTPFDTHNIFLAPNASIRSDFDFHDYSDSVFRVKMKYKTCGKEFTENYTLNVQYFENETKIDRDPAQISDILKSIDQSIQALSDRFL